MRFRGSVFILAVLLMTSLSYGQTEHFTPVESTGLPYTVILYSASIEGEDLEAGDEVGMFDGDLCVGANTVEQTITRDNAFNVITWQGDPATGLEGFTPDNPILVKLWDSSSDTEVDGVPEFEVGGTYGFGFATIIAAVTTIPGLDYFSPVNPTDVSYPIIIREAEINQVATEIGDEIAVFDNDLCVGAGIVSDVIAPATPMEIMTWRGDEGQGIPGYRDDAQILLFAWDSSEDLSYICTANFQGSGIFGEGDSQIITGLFGNILESGQAVYFDPVNRTDLSYSILVQSAVIAGEELNINDEIAVFDGDLCVGASAVESAITEMNPLEITAWRGDPDNQIPGYTPNNPITLKMWQEAGDTEYTTIHEFVSGGRYGEGFQTVVEWVRDRASEQLAVHFDPVAETGSSYTVQIDSAYYSDAVIQGQPSLYYGDEVGLFDGDVCVGAVRIIEDVSAMTPLEIITWEGDPCFTAGNAITARVWSDNLASEFDCDLVFEGAGQYGDGTGETIVTLEAVETSVGRLVSSELPSQFGIESVYPNPFNPSTTITLSVPAKEYVTLTVFNLLGEKVADIHANLLDAGQHQFTFHASLPTGTYFVHATMASGVTDTQRILLMK